jgi:hypothetical protein
LALLPLLGFAAVTTGVLSVETVDIGSYFSNSYQEARRKFLSAAKAAGVVVWNNTAILTWGPKGKRSTLMWHRLTCYTEVCVDIALLGSANN